MVGPVRPWSFDQKDQDYGHFDQLPTLVYRKYQGFLNSMILLNFNKRKFRQS